MRILPTLPYATRSKPRHMAVALTALLACTASMLTPEAQAFQPSAAVSALVCNAQSPTDARPSRSWGVSNYGAKGTNVSCPLNRPANSAPVYGVMVYAQAKPGVSLNCYLVSLRKQDNALLGFKLFGMNGPLAGMQSIWVFLEPYERSADAVQEVSCFIPPNGGARLNAFEVFAG